MATSAIANPEPRTETDIKFLRAKIVATVLVVLITYIGSYFALSRYGQHRHPIGAGRKFFYVPLDPHRVFTSNALRGLHETLCYIYYPVWTVDHHVFNGPEYAEFFY